MPTLSATGKAKRWITPRTLSLTTSCVRPLPLSIPPIPPLPPNDPPTNTPTEALDRIQAIKGTDFSFWVGETNWPTGGANFEDAIPSTENAATYWKESICAILNWGVNVFVFSAFDEEWKPAEKDNSVEKHWGVFKDDGTPKYDLTC